MPEQMTMGQMLHFTDHLKYVKSVYPVGPSRDKALITIMDQLDECFHIPDVDTGAFAKQYPGVMEMYITINEARRQ